MTTLTLYAKLETLPPELKSEASDFIDFLLEKTKRKGAKEVAPKFGSLKGKIKMSDDFDAPMEDFNEYM